MPLLWNDERRIPLHRTSHQVTQQHSLRILYRSLTDNSRFPRGCMFSPPTDDEVFDTSGYRDVSLLVHGAFITSMHPDLCLRHL